MKFSFPVILSIFTDSATPLEKKTMALSALPESSIFPKLLDSVFFGTLCLSARFDVPVVSVKLVEPMVGLASAFDTS